MIYYIFVLYKIIILRYDMWCWVNVIKGILKIFLFEFMLYKIIIFGKSRNGYDSVNEIC